MTITGSVSAENGNYSVSLNPTGTSLTPANQSFNGFSPWLSTDQIKYMALLNPIVQYTVSMQLTDTGGNKTDLSQITFYKATTYVSTEPFQDISHLSCPSPQDFHLFEEGLVSVQLC